MSKLPRNKEGDLPVFTVALDKNVSVAEALQAIQASSQLLASHKYF